MKKILLVSLIMFISSVFADVEWKVNKVYIDSERGTIIVETNYRVNGGNTIVGRTRYNENNFKTQEEFYNLAINNIKDHAKLLVMKIPENKAFVKAKMQLIQSALAQPLITSNDNNVTYKLKDTMGSENTKQITFKDKIITVTSDGSNSVADVK